MSAAWRLSFKSGHVLAACVEQICAMALAISAVHLSQAHTILEAARCTAQRIGPQTSRACFASTLVMGLGRVWEDAVRATMVSQLSPRMLATGFDGCCACAAHSKTSARAGWTLLQWGKLHCCTHGLHRPQPFLLIFRLRSQNLHLIARMQTGSSTMMAHLHQGRRPQHPEGKQHRVAEGGQCHVVPGSDCRCHCGCARMAQTGSVPLTRRPVCW